MDPLGYAGPVLMWGAIAAICGQFVTLFTIMFNARQARLRAERARKWELEDRAAMAHGLHAAIADNTQKTDLAIVAAQEAYTEANHVNMKLAALGMENGDLLRQMAGSSAEKTDS